jgi:hypothetical protein
MKERGIAVRRRGVLINVPESFFKAEIKMPQLPLADDVAIAIVAACREVSPHAWRDEAIAVASKDSAGLGHRGRHYAMHALRRVFPDAKPEILAALVGAPGKPHHFWRNSCSQVANPTGHSSYAVSWWNREVYERVVRAIEADRTRRAVAPSGDGRAEPATKPLADCSDEEIVDLRRNKGIDVEPTLTCWKCGGPRKPGPRFCDGCREKQKPRPKVSPAAARRETPREAAERIIAAAENGQRFGALGGREYDGPKPLTDKRAAYEELARAAANTAREQAELRDGAQK